jgi:TetR/AcrR family transcriptional repressor of mexJK operon
MKMSTGRKRRGPGRPRDFGKVEAILDAAYDLFLERGIATTSMDAIAERASVSKMTVYANFRDKSALLAAVIERRKKTLSLPELLVGSDLKSSLEGLAQFGQWVVSVATQPEVVRVARLMAESADEHPRLAATFYNAGRGDRVKRVAAFLKSLADKGLLEIEDPDLTAEQLIASWLGLSELRQSLGLAGPPAPNEIARRVRYAIDTMVRAWSRGSAGNSDKTRLRQSPTRRRVEGM